MGSLASAIDRTLLKASSRVPVIAFLTSPFKITPSATAPTASTGVSYPSPWTQGLSSPARTATGCISPGVKKAIAEGVEDMTARVIRKDGTVASLSLKCAGLTADERQILQEGCLMNYYAIQMN